MQSTNQSGQATPHHVIATQMLGNRNRNRPTPKYGISDALPLTEYTPACHPVGENETAPGPTLADLDHRFPYAAFCCGIGDAVTRVVRRDHMIGLSSETQDFARGRLDG